MNEKPKNQYSKNQSPKKIKTRKTKFQKPKPKKINQLLKLYKNFKTLYNLTKIEQEALDLCIDYEIDSNHITSLLDLILAKFKVHLCEFETIIK